MGGQNKVRAAPECRPMFRNLEDEATYAGLLTAIGEEAYREQNCGYLFSSEVRPWPPIFCSTYGHFFFVLASYTIRRLLGSCSCLGERGVHFHFSSSLFQKTEFCIRPRPEEERLHMGFSLCMCLAVANF